MSIETFERYEKKYLMDASVLPCLLEALSEYMIPDAFNKDGQCYSICNLYYDTPSYELIRESIEKPVYKEKLRLRSYGKPGLEDQVFLELKKKFKGVVYKRRSAFVLNEAYEFIDRKTLPEEQPYMNMQVAREILYFMQRFELSSKVYLAYDRKAYFGKEDPEFRVTFDTNIRFRKDELKLEAGTHGIQLMDPSMWLMEVKIPGAVPLWFTKLLMEYQLYPVSYSKYGTYYKKTLDKFMKLRGTDLCLNQYLPRQLTRHSH